VLGLETPLLPVRGHQQAGDKEVGRGPVESHEMTVPDGTTQLSKEAGNA
jgi:hypothetical protein